MTWEEIIVIRIYRNRFLTDKFIISFIKLEIVDNEEQKPDPTEARIKSDKIAWSTYRDFIYIYYMNIMYIYIYDFMPF